MRRSGHVVVVFLHGDAEARGWNKEALELCCAEQLPVVLVDLHASDAHESLAGGDGAEALANFACGVPTIAVDGCDVVAVYRVASEALARARQDGGPTLIECLGPEHEAMRDWDAAERPQDPIEAMENYLTRKGLMNAARKAEAIAEAERELSAATGSA